MRKMSRRDFLKKAGMGAATVAFTSSLPKGVFVRRSGRRALRLLQWSHSVPSHDTWFDQWAKQWGETHNIDVVVDHIGLADLRSTFASEVSAGRGHDIVEFINPPSDFELGVMDLADLNQEAQKRFGKQVMFATRSSRNPDTGKYYGFCHGWTIDAGNYPKPVWQKAGKPNGPATWEDLLAYGAKIKNEQGVQVGIGISRELDSNMAERSLLWSFGTSIQDRYERVTLDNKKTIDAVKYMTSLYQGAMTPEVFGWTAASNNQLLIAGRASYILNAISAYRSAQYEVPEVAKDIFFTPALKGPGGKAWACEHVYVTVIPDFAKANADIAKQFLLDRCANYDEAMWESKLYNSPAYFNTAIPNGARGYPAVQNAKNLRDLHNAWFSNDPFALPGERTDKLVPLKDAEKWSTNVGFPGPANPAEGEIFGTFVLPNMFGRVAQEKQSAEESVKQAAAECKRIFNKWRARDLIGKKARRRGMTANT